MLVYAIIHLKFDQGSTGRLNSQVAISYHVEITCAQFCARRNVSRKSPKFCDRPWIERQTVGTCGLSEG